MKREIKNGMIISLICVIIAFVWAYTGNNITNVYEEGILDIFSTAIFALGIVCLAIWSIQLFTHTGSLSEKSTLRETDNKKRQVKDENNRQKRSAFIYAFLFDLVVYALAYIIISI